MNIIEAIKSGKKFKRPDWPAFVLEAEMREPVDGYYEILPEDLLADDYEVDTAPVQITREQLYTAYSEALQEVYDMTDIKPNAGVIKLIYQKLGL